MKVFISWSGQTSHNVAIILRDWLPSVIQSVAPYVSSEDIDKGARWSSDIAGELDKSAFGILCVTKNNVDAPWLNFEAGALGKSIDKSRVCPFLYKIKRSEVEGPILQFQSTICEKEDVLKLLKSINASCAEQGIDEGRLEKGFDVWWPSLKKELDAIHEEKPPQETPEKKQSPNVHMEKVLEEVLELSRLNQKILRNPEELFPPPYLEKLLNRSVTRDTPDLFDHPAFEDLIYRHLELVRCIRSFCESHKKVSGIGDVNKAMDRVREPLRFIVHRLMRRSGRLSPKLIDELMLDER